MRTFPALLCLSLLGGADSGARVVRLEILSRSDVAGGKSFAPVGPFEKLEGKVYFSVPVGNPHNAQVVDLDKAPQTKGEVAFSADFYLLRPKHAGRSNGALLLEIPNRGGKGALRLINRGTGTDTASEEGVGDGFLMRRGFTVAWLGWQSDLPSDANYLRLYAPVASAAHGPLLGKVRSDFTVAEKVFEHPLGHWIVGRIGGRGYPVLDLNDGSNSLTVRDGPLRVRRTIPRAQWRFARKSGDKLVSDNEWIHLQSGFEPGKIYEVVYTAKDPAVTGLGLVAVRDFVSHLKHTATEAGGPLDRAYAIGVSQSGRFLRHFLYQDFNVDEQDRQVLDGMIVHVAGGGRGSFNHRFAQPSRDGQPLSSLFYPTDLYPFTDLPTGDPLTRESKGLLDAAMRSKSAPKIFYTYTSYEYWSRAASLIHTSVDGTKDVDPADNSRIYFFAGLQHFSGPFPPSFGPALDLRGQQPQNPNPVTWFWRASVTNLDDWVARGIPPPLNQYPRISNGTLVTRKALAFPALPNIQVPATVHQAYRLDFGPSFKAGVITREPPSVGESFVTLVPQVDGDGNDLGGIALPQLRVPLATYTGWNLRDPKIGNSRERQSFIGSYIPFNKTKGAREELKDPRPSISERYANRDHYIGLYSQAALSLVESRFLLPEDVPSVLQRGLQEWDVAMGN